MAFILHMSKVYTCDRVDSTGIGKKCYFPKKMISNMSYKHRRAGKLMKKLRNATLSLNFL